MSYHEYLCSQELEKQDQPFYALLMACMRKADDENTQRLIHAWPEVWIELYRRYNDPGGCVSWKEWMQMHGQELQQAPEEYRERYRLMIQKRCRQMEKNAEEAMQTILNMEVL